MPLAWLFLRNSPEFFGVESATSRTSVKLYSHPVSKLFSTAPISMNRSFVILISLLLSQLLFAELDNAKHLKGISYLYMDVDSSMASDISAGEELDLNDIMELQLRRGDIDLRPFVANQPSENIPLVQLSIDTTTRDSTDEFELVLRIHDYVTIDRNGEKTIATIYEMRRVALSTGTSSKKMDDIKSELRDLMAEFVSVFKTQNY